MFDNIITGNNIRGSSSFSRRNVMHNIAQHYIAYIR